MNDLEQTNMLQPLVDEIETAVSNAKKEIAEKVNSVITETYWKIGKYIVEFEQDGNVKAAYGSKLLTTLSHAEAGSYAGGRLSGVAEEL